MSVEKAPSPCRISAACSRRPLRGPAPVKNRTRSPLLLRTGRDFRNDVVALSVMKKTDDCVSLGVEGAVDGALVATEGGRELALDERDGEEVAGDSMLRETTFLGSEHDKTRSDRWAFIALKSNDRYMPISNAQSTSQRKAHPRYVLRPAADGRPIKLDAITRCRRPHCPRCVPHHHRRKQGGEPPRSRVDRLIIAIRRP